DDAALDPAELREPLLERDCPRAVGRRRAGAEEADGRQLLLSARRKREGGYRTTNQRNELAPLQRADDHISRSSNRGEITTIRALLPSSQARSGRRCRYARLLPVSTAGVGTQVLAPTELARRNRWSGECVLGRSREDTRCSTASRRCRSIPARPASSC